MIEPIFSGFDHIEFVPALQKNQATGMFNVLDARPELLEALDLYPGHWVLDCGAPQNNTDLEGYADFITEHGDRFKWISNLDVIGNQRQSNLNYERLLKRIPSQLHSKILWVYQYRRETLRDLKPYLREHGPFIGVGGLMKLVKGDTELKNLWYAMDEMGEIFMDLDCQGQFFCVGNYRTLIRYASAPFVRSCDSTLWLCAVRSRELLDIRGRRHDATLWGHDKIQNLESNVRIIQGWPKTNTNIMPRVKRGKKLPTLFDALLPQEEVQDANIA